MEDGIELTKGADVANTLNNFFVEKIKKLKDNIKVPDNLDPLEKLKERMKDKTMKFELKQVSISTAKKLMGKMKAKKSAGADEISQECLLLGKRTLAGPLTGIINESIKEGVVPECWKEAVVIPIHKKGDKKDKAKYSCMHTI